MMAIVLLILIVVIVLFGFVLLFGAPYLPTLKSQQDEALKLLDLDAGQTLIELGSGDGRMLIAAAKLGIKSVGYELNPLLAAYSWVTSRRYKGLIKIRCANFWRVHLPQCDGIYVFILDRYMTKLHNKITQEISNPVKLVSFAFAIPDNKPVTEINGLYLYKYTTNKSQKK